MKLILNKAKSIIDKFKDFVKKIIKRIITKNFNLVEVLLI